MTRPSRRPGPRPAGSPGSGRLLPAGRRLSSEVVIDPVAPLTTDPVRLTAPSGTAGSRGFRGAGRGATSYVDAPPEWRGTSVQVCGLWPFGSGSGSPMIGVPVGRHLITAATVCCDPISWFTRARLIANPSLFVLGRPGLGKSSLVRRMCLGLIAQGVTPLVLGDLKPDYVDLITAVGGQVVRIGRGIGGLNPLDPGGLRAAVAQLSGRDRDELAAEMHGRQVVITAGLIELVRRARLADHEQAALAAAITILNRTTGTTTGTTTGPAEQSRSQGRSSGPVPVLADLIEVLRDGPPEIHAAVWDRGDPAEYERLVDPLLRSLTALVSGVFGEVFAGAATASSLLLDAPAVCMDTSSIADTDERLQAAVLLACWSHGFGSIVGGQALADAGLRPQRIYLAVLDELWRVLRAGEGLVDRIDGVTRLNRQHGLGQIMITHTMKDLDSLPTVEDRMKARGFVERAGAVALAGLSEAEMGSLREVVHLSRVEQHMVTEWATPPAWDSTRGAEAEPPGLGRFLIKVGGRPGIPLRVQLTASELDLHDTNRRWADARETGGAR